MAINHVKEREILDNATNRPATIFNLIIYHKINSNRILSYLCNANAP